MGPGGVAGPIGPSGPIGPIFKPTTTNFIRDTLEGIGTAISQSANDILLGGNPDETVSSRAGRGEIGGASAIDAVFGAGHTQESASLFLNQRWPGAGSTEADKFNARNYCCK
tara:strand:+ start:55 stop:390 length:336 start_codon:yes stop_codon:yes gene_type:complete